MAQGFWGHNSKLNSDNGKPRDEILIQSNHGKLVLIFFIDVFSCINRFGKPEECAGAVAYLVSDDSTYVTGETIVVAGGMHSHL